MSRTEVAIDDMERGIQLVGGSQDGTFVSSGSGWLPCVLFVGRCWLGDGKATWSREQSERFPQRYEFDGTVFRFGDLV